MSYNPTLHHRRSIRLKGYDYSSPGAYFITLCTQNRENFFGYIEEGILHLNDAGMMIQKWYEEVSLKFANVTCDEMVVMPNHFHCIWQITTQEEGVNIPAVVQWFKTMTTNEYIHGVKELGWQPFDKRLWLRNYFERIIRDPQAYENIRNYIRTNPARADPRVCPLGDDTEDIGADDIGADLLGADTKVRSDIGTGDIGADTQDRSDIGADTQVRSDIEADTQVRSDIGADTQVRSDIGADTQVRPNGPDPKARVRADLGVCPYDHDEIKSSKI